MILIVKVLKRNVSEHFTINLEVIIIILCASITQNNPPFSGDISWAQFYYLDRFLLLTTSNTLLLYKYQLDTSRPDDIKRYARY